MTRQSIEHHTVYLSKAIAFYPRVRFSKLTLHVDHKTGTPLEENPVVGPLLKQGYEVSMFWYDWPQPEGVRI